MKTALENCRILAENLRDELRRSHSLALYQEKQFAEIVLLDLTEQASQLLSKINRAEQANKNEI